MTSRPTPPIELTGTASLLDGPDPLPDGLVDALRAHCEVDDDTGVVAEASRDWWPLAMHWALHGRVPRRAAAIARPRSTAEVAAVLAACSAAGVAVTPAGGRSSVVGGAAPLAGGILLDLTALSGVVSVDAVSGMVEVKAGTFGPDMDDAIRPHGLTVGHFPQSHALATIGGWIGHRGAGQYSTRYGKIEDMVAGLEVVLADGTVVRTGAGPAGAQGPDLTQLFVGSEGTLGVVTTAWLRAHPLPAAERRAAYAVATLDDGLDACRGILRRGATPAVLRLYDAAESARGQGADGTYCVILVVDEGDPLVIDAAMAVVDAEIMAHPGARCLSDDLVERWMHHRNDTSALQALTRKGYVVDTMEIAGPWAALPTIVREAEAAMLAVPHARAATCHLSHSYLDGACLYFTFAATPPPGEVEQTYAALWDAGQRAVLAHGGNLSHHHGVGANRARFMAEALGPAMGVLQAVKDALDPTGILNPGKLGLRSPLGPLNLGGIAIP